MNEIPEKQAPLVPAQESRRRRWLTILSVLLVIAASGAALRWALEGRYHESTDDAYVAGDVVQITPQLGGTVLAVHADDTDVVKAGAPLVDLDPADARVALAQSEAALAQAVREERRAGVGPDRGVLPRRLGRTHAQDDAVEDQPPDRGRDLDDAAVGQELRQVAADRGRRRRVRRA